MTHSPHGIAGLAHDLRRHLQPTPFTTETIQWGKVHSINTQPRSVNLLLDGVTQLSTYANTPTACLTKKVRYLRSYTPTVGDVVVVLRRLKTDRLVLGTLATAEEPGFIPGETRARLYASGQVIVLASGVVTKVTGLTTTYVNGSLSVASSTITIGKAGTYAFAASVIFQNSDNPPGAGNYQLFLYHNGSQVRADQRTGSGSHYPAPAIADTIKCAANDTLALYAYQSSGANQALGIKSTWPVNFSVWRIA